MDISQLKKLQEHQATYAMSEEKLRKLSTSALLLRHIELGTALHEHQAMMQFGDAEEAWKEIAEEAPALFKMFTEIVEQQKIWCSTTAAEVDRRFPWPEPSAKRQK